MLDGQWLLENGKPAGIIIGTIFKHSSSKYFDGRGSDLDGDYARIWVVGDAVAVVAASRKVGGGGIMPVCGIIVLGIIGGGGGDTTGP